MLIGNYFYYEIPTSFPQLTVTSFYFVLFCFAAFCLSRAFKCVLRPYVLFVANIVFIWSFSKDMYYLTWLLLASVFAYAMGLLIGKKNSRYVLITAIALPVLVLVYFKYAGLVTSKSIIMPLGMSFYLFKIISYFADIYRGKCKAEMNPLYFLDYVMFFPCITAGPINRFSSFINELRDPRDFDYVDAKNGGFQLAAGIFEKIVFCDFIAQIVAKTLGNPECAGYNLLFGIFMYSFQIYLDFDSISNIAIGASRLLGFDVGQNFRSPYLACTLQDFWKRWHISLSSWFRDYIYIPLGGNRLGRARQCLNLMMVFIVSGLWHGSTINFLIWGLLHGFVQIIENTILRYFKGIRLNDLAGYILEVFGIVTNFIIVSFLWLVFRSESMADVVSIISRLFHSGSFSLVNAGLTINECYWLLIVLTVVIVLDVVRNCTDAIDMFSRFYLPVRWLVYAAMIVVFLVLGVYGGSFEAADFIYRFF